MELEWSAFKPTGGFPPIIWENESVPTEKTLESRGFSNTVASISNILQSKVKDNFLGIEDLEDDMIGFGLNEAPHDFSRINKKGKNIKKIKK